MAALKTWQRWALGIALWALYGWGLTAAPDLWLAMPPLLAAVAMAVVGSGVIAGVSLGMAVIGSLTLGNLIMITTMVYGVVSARSAAKKAARNARDAYNNSLTDRTTSVMSAEAPWQVVYGEAVVGGFIVAILTSGDKDQFKHVVVVWAAHECDAITDVMLGGVSVGALDGSGYVTGGKWAKTSTLMDSETVSLNGAGSATLSLAPGSILSLSEYTIGGQEGAPWMLGPADVDVVGNVVTVHPEHVEFWAGKWVIISYNKASSSSLLRVRHHLGTAGQTADALTVAEVPADWTSNDRLRGLCYSVLRFDLNEPEFQGGPPQMTARIRGKKVYDHRTGVTAWSANPAVCTADFLQAEYGKKALSTQLLWASINAAANVCDEALASQGGAKRYSCNGALRTDQSADATLEQLCQSMGGFATYTGAWHLQAGAYAAPVMDLSDADI